MCYNIIMIEPEIRFKRDYILRSGESNYEPDQQVAMAAAYSMYNPNKGGPYLPDTDKPYRRRQRAESSLLGRLVWWNYTRKRHGEGRGSSKYSRDKYFLQKDSERSFEIASAHLTLLKDSLAMGHIRNALKIIDSKLMDPKTNDSAWLARVSADLRRILPEDVIGYKPSDTITESSLQIDSAINAVGMIDSYSELGGEFSPVARLIYSVACASAATRADKPYEAKLRLIEGWMTIENGLAAAMDVATPIRKENIVVVKGVLSALGVEVGDGDLPTNDPSKPYNHEFTIDGATLVIYTGGSTNTYGYVVSPEYPYATVRSAVSVERANASLDDPLQSR